MSARCASVTSGVGRAKNLGRNDALGQVIDAFEAAAPRRRRDVSRPKEPLEGPLGVTPFPPARPAAFFLESEAARGPGADALKKAFSLCPTLVRENPQTFPTGLSAIRAGHPPTHQGMQRQRQERRLMGPIFEQPPLFPASPRSCVDQRTVIGSKSGEGRQGKWARTRTFTLSI